MDDIELETRFMVDEGAELKHGVTCLRSRPIENSLVCSHARAFVEQQTTGAIMSVVMHV